MEAYRERNLFRQRMYMHNSRVTGTDDAFVFKNSQLCLKLTHGVDRLRRATEHEPRADIFVFDTTQSNSDVVAAECTFNFLLQLCVNSSHFDCDFIGHEYETV